MKVGQLKNAIEQLNVGIGYHIRNLGLVTAEATAAQADADGTP